MSGRDDEDRFVKLASLWPRLTAALARDTGRDEAVTVRGSAAHRGDSPANVNLEVLRARITISDGLRRQFSEIAPLLRLDVRRGRTIEDLIAALPRWHAALEARGLPTARYLGQDVDHWLRAAERALGLITAETKIGRLCPHHRDQPAELVREGDKATLADSIIRGRAQSRGEAPLSWRRGSAVRCRSCGERWASVEQLRILMLMIDEADRAEASPPPAVNSATQLLDGPAIAAALSLHDATIRNWASAGRIARHGRDSAGRTLYDLAEVAQVAATPSGRGRPRRTISGD